MAIRISRPKAPSTGTLLTNAQSVSPSWRIPNRPDTGAFQPHDPPDPTLTLDCELFSLGVGGAALFGALDSWTLDEAALLLAGANPGLIKLFDADPNIYKPDYGTCGYPALRFLLARAFESGVLIHPCKPHDIVAWAAGKGLVVPAPLLALVTSAPAQTPATPVPVVPATKGKRWTTEKLAELKTYRDAHTMPETAAKFGITEQRIRQLLPSGKPQKKPYSVFTHHIK